MEKLSAWKVFKITTAITAGLSAGKLLALSATYAVIGHLKKKYPEHYEKAVKELETEE